MDPYPHLAMPDINITSLGNYYKILIFIRLQSRNILRLYSKVMAGIK